MDDLKKRELETWNILQAVNVLEEGCAEIYQRGSGVYYLAVHDDYAKSIGIDAGERRLPYVLQEMLRHERIRGKILVQSAVKKALEIR